MSEPGFPQVLNTMIQIVSDTTPNFASHKRFVHLRDQAGLPSLHVITGEGDRVFEIRMVTPPVYDDASGWNFYRWRVGLELRIRYSVSNGFNHIQLLIGSDTPLLTHALMDRREWPIDQAIDAVTHVDSPGIDEVYDDSPEAKDEAVALILVLPFEVIFRDPIIPILD